MGSLDRGIHFGSQASGTYVGWAGVPATMFPNWLAKRAVERWVATIALGALAMLGSPGSLVACWWITVVRTLPGWDVGYAFAEAGSTPS